MRTDKEYLEGDYFSPDEETENYSRKIVTTRKEHWCSGWTVNQSHTIPSGTRAILETAVHLDDGRVSNYLCLQCADTFFAEINL